MGLNPVTQALLAGLVVAAGTADTKAASVAAAAVAASHQAAVVAVGHRDQAEVQQNFVVAAGDSSCQQALPLPAGTPAVTGTAAASVVAAVTRSWAGGRGAGQRGAVACGAPPGHFAARGLRGVQSSAKQQCCL